MNRRTLSVIWQENLYWELKLSLTWIGKDWDGPNVLVETKRDGKE